MSTALHRERLAIVLDRLLAAGTRSVLDLGCGDGAFLLDLATAPGIEKVTGIELDAARLAELRQRLATLPGKTARKVTLRQASIMAPDPALVGFDAAVMIETIEHIDAERLSALEHAVFATMAPRLVLVTTPNAAFNPLLGVPAHRFRHPDHRFEWDRDKFARWAAGVGRRHRYAATTEDLGASHPTYGAPSQMAVFTRPDAS